MCRYLNTLLLILTQTLNFMFSSESRFLNPAIRAHPLLSQGYKLKPWCLRLNSFRMGSALDTSIHTNPDTSIQGRFFIQLSRYIFYIKDFFSTFEYNNTIVLLCNSFLVHFPLETLLSTFLPFKPSQYSTFLPSPLSIDHLLRTFLP